MTEDIKNKLKQKLIRNDRLVTKLFRQYRGGDDWPTPLASSKFINLLAEEKFQEAEQMILDDEFPKSFDLTSFWDSIYDAYFVGEAHPIGTLTVKKLKWFHDYGMAPSEKQKGMLIPLICNNKAEWYSYKNDPQVTKDVVHYLYLNGYPIFDINSILQRMYDGTGFNTKEGITSTINDMFKLTLEFITEHLLVEKDICEHKLLIEKDKNALPIKYLEI